MIIRDDGFIVKGKKFTPSEVERILINYMETENEDKIKLKQFEYDGESLVEFCKRAYNHDRNTCDNYHFLFIRRPYTYKSMKRGLVRDCFPNITIIDILKDTQKWKDYIIKKIHYGADCTTNVTAELPCKTVNDLIYYCEDDINKDCVFKEMLTDNNFYYLDYVKIHREQFEETVFVKEVDVDENKKIKCVHFMKNGGD